MSYSVLAVSVYLLCCSAGCIGPSSVRSERTDYNEAIALTSRQQVLLNIVRVHNHEQPQFLDVSAITNQSQFTGTLNGSAMLPQGVGALGQVGSTPRTVTGHTGHDFTPGFSVGGYDQPSITYSPLTGQALVQQIAQPITVDSIAALYDSDWPIRSILTFVADRLSPNPDDYFTVINTIEHLQIIGVLTIVAVKSPASGGSGGNDTLVLFCDPKRASPSLVPRATKEWDYLKSVYSAAYVDPLTIGPAAPKPAKEAPDGASPQEYSIELRTVPATQPSLPAAQVIPLLRTRSALGVLVTSTEDVTQYITFLSPPAYDVLWKPHQDKLFYQYVPFTLDRKVEVEESLPEEDKRLFADRLSADSRAAAAARQSWRRQPQPPAATNPTTRRTDTENPENQVVKTAIGWLTRPRNELPAYTIAHYIAVVEGTSSPGNAYASIGYRGRHYYIQGGDIVSQRNFELLTQLLNMQSVVPATPPPTPTISVGGH